MTMRPPSLPSQAEMKPGNIKGTNPGPPSSAGRTRRTAVVLRTPRPVLNSTATNSGPPFGTKRPQVQILSPRPVPQVSDLREGRTARCPTSPHTRQTPPRNKEYEGIPGKGHGRLRRGEGHPASPHGKADRAAGRVPPNVWSPPGAERMGLRLVAGWTPRRMADPTGRGRRRIRANPGLR